MVDHTSYFQHPTGVDIEEESALSAAERAEVAADAAEGYATQAGGYATDANSWSDLSKAWATQLGSMVDEGAGGVDYSSKHYATVVAAGEASNAAASAAAAVATLQEFERAYLGSKASAPLVDNEGGALQTGAVYWDTTLGLLQLYNGTAWQDWDPVDLIVPNWTAATTYPTAGTAVVGSDGVLYVSAVAHTSGSDFNADVNAGYWLDVHPSTGVSVSTEIQFSADGVTWRDHYADGDTWIRQRDIPVSVKDWPASVAELTSPHQRGGWDGYIGSWADTEISDDVRSAKVVGTGAIDTYGGQINHPSRNIYIEVRKDGTQPGAGPYEAICIANGANLDTGVKVTGVTSGYRIYIGDSTAPNTGTLEFTTSGGPTDGDIIQFAINHFIGKVWVGLNGVWQGDGTQDPVRELGGYDFANLQYGSLLRMIATATATNQGWSIPEDITYVPPQGYTLYGNPNMGGFLSVTSDDDRWADTVFLQTWKGVKEAQKFGQSAAVAPNMVEESIWKHSPWSFADTPNYDVYEGPQRQPSPIGETLASVHGDFTAWYPGYELQIPAGEDYTIEALIRTEHWDGNRSHTIWEMSGTGQKNNPNASARSTALGAVDSGAATAATGPMLLKTVEATNSALNTAIYSNNTGDYVGGEWQHVIWERVGSTTYLVVNGSLKDSGSDTLENEAFGFLPPVTSGYTDNNGSNSFSLGSTFIPSGHRALQGNMAQIRVTRRGARYGLNNWPTEVTAAWAGAVVDEIDYGYWKVYRINSGTDVQNEIAVEFSNGNGDWHEGYERGDTLGRFVQGASDEGRKSAIVWDISMDTSMQIDSDGDLAHLVTGADYRNGYSTEDFFDGDKFYFECRFEHLEQQGTERIGVIGANRKIRDATPDVSIYGGFAWLANGTHGDSPNTARWTVGTHLAFAVDVAAKKYWLRLNGKWQTGEPGDYDNGFDMDDSFDGVATGLCIFAANWQKSPVADAKWVYVPEEPVYDVPSGFKHVGKTNSYGASGKPKVAGTFPVGAAESGTQMEFSSDGAAWSKEYTEGDTWARLPRHVAPNDPSAGTVFDAKESPWHAGIFDAGISSAGGYLVTSDGFHATGKHYWEFTLARGKTPADELIGSDVIPQPYKDGEVFWFGDSAGAMVGVESPDIAGVGDPNDVRSGGRGWTKGMAPFSTKKRLTYGLLNYRDRYDADGNLTNGYGLQYENADRVAATEYAALKWGGFAWGVAVDCDAGKLWIIDSAGSVIPSGDPAAGTGGFDIPNTQDYRFFLYLDADPELEPLVTLKNTSSHGVPAGFTHHTAPATGGTETVHKVFRMGGAEHTFGSVAPSGANGKIGDIYTDTTGKNVYQKTAASTWTLRYSYT